MTFGKWTGSQSRPLLLAALTVSLALIAPHAEARPWAEHAGKLTSLGHQIENGEHEIHELIEQKHHAHESAQIKTLVEQIAARHQSLAKTYKDYEEERQHVRFEHPEKNDILERKYTHRDFKTIEEMEHELGIQGRLDRVKLRVLSMFPIPERPERPATPKPVVRIPASKQLDADEEAPDKIHLVK